MKVKLVIDETLVEDEIIVKCRELSDEIILLQKHIKNLKQESNKICLSKNDMEYYIDTKDILFFETTNTEVCAHTVDDVYYIKMKLYELEEMLKNNFTRISKSTVINIDQIYAIEKNIYSSDLVIFKNSHKKIYVTRVYYKSMKEKLQESRGR